MKARASRKAAAARRATRASPAAGTAGWAQAQADRARVRSAVRAPADWKPAPAPTTESDPGNVVRSDGQPLDPALRATFEPRFGVNLGSVRIHRDETAAASAESLSARAYTLGSHIVFGPGAYQPGTVAGRRLLAHEIAHTVQQRGSAIPVSTPAPLGIDGHERQASLAARAIERGWSVPALQPTPARIQRDKKDDADPIDDAQAMQLPPGTPVREIINLGREVLRKSLDDNQQDQVARAVYLVVGASVAWYDASGRFIDQFTMLDEARTWGPGIYFTYGMPAYQLMAVAGGGTWQGFGLKGDDEKWSLITNWLVAADHKRFDQRTGSQPDQTPYLILIPPPSPGGGAATVDGGVGAAERLVDEVRRRLKESADASQPTTPDAPDATPESEPAPEAKPDPRIPDRLVVWSDERGVWVNVWADGAVDALPVRPDETTDQLDQAVRDASERLRTSRDPAQSTKLADGARRTGFVGREDPNPVKLPTGKAANLPAYPSRILNRSDDITVTGATKSFEMELEYEAAGGGLANQVLARMQTIHYRWELIDVTHVKPEDRGASAATDEGERASRLSGEATAISRDFSDIAEDTAADLDDTLSGDPAVVAATWPARSAWLTVVGVSNIVRMGGSLISSFIRVLTRPMNEESIGFDREGEFLVRCIATPEQADDGEWVRASSIAVTAIKVQNIDTRAVTANRAPLTRIRELEAERDRATGEARDRLTARIDALRRADSASVGAAAGDALDAIDQSIAVVEEVIADNRQNKPRDQRTAKARLLAAQLELQQIDADQYHTALIEQRREVKARLGLSLVVSLRMPWGSYRPHVTIASEENGQVTDVLTMLGEASDSAEGSRHWLLADLTSANPRDRYVFEGKSSQAGLAGHSEAVRKAFVDFRENNGYGRGTIAIRFPEGLETAVGGHLAVEDTMRSAPGSHRRVMQRLRDLATAAEIAGLLVTGPALIAVGVVGGIAGAIVAVDNMARRSEAGALRWDFETIMDIASIVGGFVAAGSAPLHGLGKLPKWARRVERIQGAIHIFGVTQLGVSVIAIPIQLEEQLTQIENTPNLSPGERAARRAEAWLGAVRSGIVTVSTARQMMQPLGGGPETAAESEPLRAPGEVLEKPAAPVGEPEARPAEAPGHAGAPGQPARSARVEALEPVLGDLQGKVSLVENPDLHGKSARVRYGKDGVRIEIGTDVPPEAQVRAVERHLGTARTLLKYQGPLGAVHRLLSRIVEVFTHIPGYGKQGFESRLEVRKLSEIASSLEQTRRALDERMAGLAEKDATQLAREKAAIERELSEVKAQLELHQAMIDSLDPALGHVAAYDPRTIANHPALRTQLDHIGVAMREVGRENLTSVVDALDRLQRSGRVRGLEDWILAAAAQAHDPAAFLVRLGELGQAFAAVEVLPPGHVLDLVPSAPVASSAGSATFSTTTTAGPPPAAPAPNPVLDPVRARFTKPGMDPDLAIAFDRWIDRVRSFGGNVEAMVQGMDRKPREIETTVNRERAHIQLERAHAAQLRNLGDLLHPGFTPVPDGNVTLQYKTRPPSSAEIEHAKRVQTRHGEPVTVFGDDVRGEDYPAIDGTIGRPERPMQLKTFGTSIEPYSARGAAMDALEQAQKFGIRGLEVYMEFDVLDVEDIERGWNIPGGVQPKAPGPVFDGPVVAHIEIQCRNGRVRVHFDAATSRYTFDRLK